MATQQMESHNSLSGQSREATAGEAPKIQNGIESNLSLAVPPT